MAEPTPLSKKERSFSFGQDIDLSLSLPGSSTSNEDPPSYQPPLKRLPSGRSVHFESIQERPESILTYNSSIPYAESSRSAQDRETSYENYRNPSDFEIFLAKSREDYERDKQRNWPTVEIDEESFIQKHEIPKKETPKKKLSTIRTVLRVLQVFIRYLSF
jgi:hypothetical protein